MAIFIPNTCQMIYTLLINDFFQLRQLFSKYTMIIIVFNIDYSKLSGLKLPDLYAVFDLKGNLQNYHPGDTVTYLGLLLASLRRIHS